MSLADLIADPGAAPGARTDGVLAVGEVEKLGPATIARIKEWVGHSRVSVRPVLDLARTDAVDEHDPPEWMRELVILRDQHCVFPWCSRDARACDLDHVEPYDEDGPPGQTRPENLAPLCRRHHRCKTSGRWRYRRRPDGTLRLDRSARSPVPGHADRHHVPRPPLSTRPTSDPTARHPTGRPGPVALPEALCRQPARSKTSQ